MTESWKRPESQPASGGLFRTAVLEILEEVKIKPRAARKNPFLEELFKLKEEQNSEISTRSRSDGNQSDEWADRLRTSIHELEAQKDSQRTFKIMKKLNPFVESLKNLMQICENVVQDAPLGVSIAFTGARLVLSLAFEVQSQLDIIIEALEDLGDMLKFCQRLINYDNDPDFQRLLLRSFKDIIGFWLKASQALSGSLFKVMARNVINPLRVVIKEALDRLKMHSKGLEKHAFLTGLLRAEHDSKEAAGDKEKKLKHDIAIWVRGNDNLDVNVDIAEQLSRRQDGTCAWVLEEPKFKDWRDGLSGSVLWYHAPPGSGKSVLASAIVDHLRKRTEKVIAFFYSYSSDTKRYSISGLRSVILQLLSMTRNVPDRATQIFDDNKTYTPSLQSSSVAAALVHQLLSPLDHIYIIIDGLDECPDTSQLLSDLSGLVQEKVYATVKWLFLSRYRDHFRKTMGDVGAVELHPKSNVISMDIQTYITSTLTCENCFNKWSDDNERNFLYARFVCETLRGRGTLRDVDIASALEQFPPSLTSYYARSIEELARRPAHEQTIVKRAFNILIAAKQSITFGELVDALSVTPESKDYQRSSLRQADDIRDLCGPLITLERRDQDSTGMHIVKFYHKTIKDFLLQNPDTLKIETMDARRYFVTEKDAQRNMGILCLTYLMDRQYTECQDLDALLKIVDKDHAFLRYAATFWWQHLNEAEPEAEMVDQVTQFLKSKAFWTCIGVQSHTAPHLFGTYIALKSGQYRMASKAISWKGEDSFGLPLPGWLDTVSGECASLVQSLCCFTQEWNEVITSHAAGVDLCCLLRCFDTSCHLKPLSKVDKRPRVDHLSDLTDLTGYSDFRMSDIKFSGTKLSAEVLCRKAHEDEDTIHSLDASAPGKVLSRSQHKIPLSGDRDCWDVVKTDSHEVEAWSIDPENLNVRRTTSEHSKRFKNPLLTQKEFEFFRNGEWAFLRAATESSQSHDRTVRILHTRWREKDQPLKDQQVAEDDSDDVTVYSDSNPDSEVDLALESDGDSTSGRSSSLDGRESMTTDSSLDDERKHTGNCLIILQPQQDPYWIKPWVSSTTRWEKVGYAMHPNLPLLAFTHTSLELELVHLEKRAQERKHLPEPMNIHGKPVASTRELRFSSCGKYLHCLVITFANEYGSTSCQVTVATYCYDPDGDSDNAFLRDQPALQCTYSFADRLTDIALPLTLTYWTEDSLLIALPPLTCDPKILLVNLPKDGSDESMQIKTLSTPIYFPSSTPHRDPRLLQRTSSDGKGTYLHLALGALFPPKQAVSPVQPRPEVQDGTRISRTMNQASPPVFLRWRISQEKGWRPWDVDQDGKSSDLKREMPVWKVLRGDFVDSNKPFSVPIRFGLDWTRKGYLSC